MVLNQLIIKVCYTFMSRYFMVRHALIGTILCINVNCSWKAVLSFSLSVCNFSNVVLSPACLVSNVMETKDDLFPKISSFAC